VVDFNNETTVGTPAVDVVRILILQRRADLFEAVEKYNKQSYQGQQADLSIVRARLKSLFLEIQAALKRRLKPDVYKELMQKIEQDDEEKIMEAIYFLNEHLDNMRLTRIDTKTQYDSTRVEIENKAKRL